MSDFECECGNKFEDYIDRDLKEAQCSCGKMAKKSISSFAYFKINGFREELHTEKWAKSRTDHAKRTNN
jgi:hypothetical protein